MHASSRQRHSGAIFGLQGRALVRHYPAYAQSN